MLPSGTHRPRSVRRDRCWRRDSRARCSSTARRSTSPTPATAARARPRRPVTARSTPRSPAAWSAPRPARWPSWSAAPRRTSQPAQPLLDVMGRKVVHCGGAGRRPGRQDLQQHDPRRLDDRGQRGVRARREARPEQPGAVRRGVQRLGPVLGADDQLPGSRPGADEPGQQRLPAGLRRRADGQGSRSGVERGARQRGRRRARPPRRRALQSVQRPVAAAGTDFSAIINDIRDRSNAEDSK